MSSNVMNDLLLKYKKVEPDKILGWEETGNSKSERFSKRLIAGASLGAPIAN